MKSHNESVVLFLTSSLNDLLRQKYHKRFIIIFVCFPYCFSRRIKTFLWILGW